MWRSFNRVFKKLKLKIWGVFIALRLGNKLIFNLKFFDKITQKNGQAHKKTLDLLFVLLHSVFNSSPFLLHEWCDLFQQ
jgi:hypothetical protein